MASPLPFMWFDFLPPSPPCISFLATLTEPMNGGIAIGPPIPHRDQKDPPVYPPLRIPRQDTEGSFYQSNRDVRFRSPSGSNRDPVRSALSTYLGDQMPRRQGGPLRGYHHDYQ